MSIERLISGLLVLLVLQTADARADRQSPQQLQQQQPGETTVAKQVSPDKSNPLLLQADNIVYDNHNNRVLATGHVEIYYNDYALLADQVVYDKSSNTLTAIGNVRLKEPDGALVNADRLTLKDDFRDGFIRSLKAVTQDDARIAAENAYRKDGNTTVYENGVFTSCKPCEAHPERPPIWRVKASRIITDKQDQKIHYENAELEIFGIPVAWLPYFYMPDPSVKRLSGFLIPRYSHSTELGYTVELPYYYSASPYYDLTLIPEITTKAGYLLQGEWRHRLWDGSYKVNLAGSYNDNADDFVNKRKFRGSVQTAGDFALNSLWHVGWNGTIESDDTFRRFYRLDSVYATDRVSQAYLTGSGDRNYFNASFYRFGNLTGKYFDYDTNQYQSGHSATALPIVDYNYIHGRSVLGGELSFDLNTAVLNIDNIGGDRSLPRDSDHVTVQSQWRRTITDDAGQVFTPFVQGRADIYHVSKWRQNTPDATLDIAGPALPEDTFTRELVAVGLDYRYPFVAHTDTASHVIEPVAQIIARSNTTNRVPNEDSQSLVFDDTLLFDINKFSGYDKIETGTRSNLGLQYTMQAYNGVSIRAVGGESVQIAGQNSFDRASGLGTGWSDYVAGGYIDYRNMFRVVSQVRFDQSDFSVARQDYSAQTKLGFFQGALSYIAVNRRPEFQLVESREIAGFSALKLNDEWTVFADARYNVQEEKFVRNSVGVQYSDECFTYSVTYAQSFVQYQDIKPDTSVMLHVGLKYLGQQTVSDSIGDLSPEAAVFK